jgi:biopolymer transport protein ExbD
MNRMRQLDDAASLLGRRQRRAAFVLTPLIDVMFLLLIFFMMSSQISPYSLISISGISTADEPASAPSPDSRTDLVLRVSAGFVGVDGERVPVSALRTALGQRVPGERTGALVLPDRSATVQDVVDVLEALQAAGIRDAALLGSAGGP